MTRPDDVEYGVYYITSDYLGVCRRLVIDLVDAVIAGLASVSFSLVVSLFVSDDNALGLAVLITWAAVGFAYFVLLKRSRVRTLGYRLARARIVNLRGEVPSVAALTIRLLFVIFGPLNLLLDLFWIPSDPSRQALRDKFAHTYVVRDASKPAGKGEIRYATYTILGGSFLFQEVRGAASPSAA